MLKELYRTNFIILPTSLVEENSGFLQMCLAHNIVHKKALLKNTLRQTHERLFNKLFQNRPKHNFCHLN